LEPASTSNASFQLVNDKNVVYSFHNYKPYVVSHAGYAGASDSPVPTSYTYPGLVLKDVYTLNWAKGFNVIKALKEWTKLESHEIIVPANVQFAALRIVAVNRIGNLWIDDLHLTQNGNVVNMLNGDIEQASITNTKLPANWRFSGSGDFVGTWDNTVNHSEAAASGKSSLKITGSTGGGLWSPVNQFYTAPLIKVKAGDKISFQAWAYAPELTHGEFGIHLEYLNGNYDLYTKDHLTTDIQPYVTWAKNNNVPLYVGEFGALSSARGASRYNLVRDEMSVMNEAGLNWSLWAYRDLGKPYFGLYLDQKLDTRLAAELKAGLQ
ncbi:MAG TPA: cellulase family glycosylhydrolase, partial [Thiolinea sp.]|nr:cellulase family glycosylhydrolase [Thiolinea sp.]